MKLWLNRNLLGTIAVGCALWCAVSSNRLYSQLGPASATPSPTSMQVVSTTTVNGVQQLVVLDQSLRSLAVYHVDATGNVQLRSVRALMWDLRMEEFNGQAPTPSELKRVQP
jgi:hypothetical protein